LLSIAVDHADTEAVGQYAAGCDFATVIDAQGEMARLFGLKVVPNGMMVDEAGVVRWAKFGGFSVDNHADVDAAVRFVAGEDPGPSPEGGDAYQLTALERELVATKVRLGRMLLEAGQREAAVAEWRGALRLDPGNFTVRKQVWSAEHPEKFYPTIDFAWQKVQLEAEREREIAEGICGPDGCPIPGIAPG
jgi:hypothetical protein